MDPLLSVNKQNTTRIETLIFLFLFLFVFLFLLFRAINIPLFVDELFSYDHYIRNGYFTARNEYSKANNHLVNTLLTYFSYHLFGNSSLALRLPNLLAFGLFSIYLYKFGLLFRTKLVKWVFWLTFLFSLNFVSFFAVSRGYGLSFTFALLSLYYTYLSFNANKLHYLILALLGILLSLFSNFSMLLFSMLIGGILLINVITNSKYYFSGKNKFIIGFLVLLFLFSIGITIDILLYYKSLNLLWWGSLEGFWEVSVMSLIHLLFNNDKWSVGIMSISVIYFIFILWKLVGKRKFEASQLFSIVFILNLLGILLLAQLFEVNYPYQRTGLHLYLFFMGSICFAIDRVEIKWLRQLFLVPLLLIPIHFFVTYNTNLFVYWEEDNLPKRFYDEVKQIECSKSQLHVPSMYIEGSTVTCWDYYYYNDFYAFMPKSINVREPNKRYYDYLIVRKENLKGFEQLYDTLDYQLTSDVVLYKRKKPIGRTILLEKSDLDYRQIDQEFYEFTRFEVDSLISPSVFIECNFELDFKRFPFFSYIVFSAEDRETKEKYAYKSIELDTKENWIKEEPFIHGGFLHNLPENRKVDILVYLWNRNGESYIIHKSKLKIHSVIEE